MLKIGINVLEEDKIRSSEVLKTDKTFSRTQRILLKLTLAQKWVPHLEHTLFTCIPEDGRLNFHIYIYSICKHKHRYYSAIVTLETF